MQSVHAVPLRTEAGRIDLPGFALADVASPEMDGPRIQLQASEAGSKLVAELSSFLYAQIGGAK